MNEKILSKNIEKWKFYWRFNVLIIELIQFDLFIIFFYLLFIVIFIY